MDVKCPYCGTEHGVPADYVGRKAECSHCKRPFIIEQPPLPPPLKKQEQSRQPEDIQAAILEQLEEITKVLLGIGIILLILLIRSCFSVNVNTEYSRGGVRSEWRLN